MLLPDTFNLNCSTRTSNSNPLNSGGGCLNWVWHYSGIPEIWLDATPSSTESVEIIFVPAILNDPSIVAKVASTAAS